MPRGSEALVADPHDSETNPRRRSLLTMALAWPACLLAARPAGAGGTRGERAGPEDPLPLTVEDRVYLAVSRFEQGFHCAQSVLAAYADGGLSEDAALKMGAALAGGSTVGGECGAVAAGYLVLGLKHARTVPTFGDVEKERELFNRIRRFVEEFRKRHGAITCRELLGVDVFTREGLAEGRQRGLFRERCPRYVRDAITIVESVSTDPGTKAPPGDGP
jgi:C_GCAxxG_C_C family probable redox protein